MKNNLKLYKNYFVPLSYNYFVYLEVSGLYLSNIIRSCKFYDNNNFIFVLNKNEISKFITLFKYNNSKYKHWYFKKYELLIEYQRLKYFKEFFYENRGKIKIIGRGWKIIKYSYQLLIKLGYSHMIFLELSPFLKYKLKKKKEKYYTFYGIFYNELNSMLNKIRLMRVPDLYTRKGIFHNSILL